MYTIYDYAYNGYLYLNNIIWPRHKRLSQLMIYSTTACQSRCKHCNIWQKRVEHLSLDDIKNIMASQCVSRHTTVGLEGGEFILHPQAAEIMAWFREHHPNYTLLSNCLAPPSCYRCRPSLSAPASVRLSRRWPRDLPTDAWA